MTTNTGKLKYDPNSILGHGYGTIVFSGFSKRIFWEAITLQWLSNVSRRVT